MLGLPPSVRIHFATDLVDMRNGIDGLRALVEATLKKDPYGGHLFVFVGKSKDNGAGAARDAPRRYRPQRAASGALESGDQQGDRHRSLIVIKPGRWSCRP
jgi:hypothetical protein